ncbi:MAG TPA: cupredoxin family copper-binding protein [Afifellaceae bacterium]|nr:cupredoxin family copper-binding protein [Afifellaceae bacterium]
MTIVAERRNVLTGIVASLAATVSAFRFSALAHNGEIHAAPPTNHEVEIKAFKFVPATLKVSPGDTITWTNRDLVPHTATAHDKSWDTGRIERGKSASITCRQGMATAYFCRFHPAMKAKLENSTDS